MKGVNFISTLQREHGARHGIDRPQRYQHSLNILLLVCNTLLVLSNSRQVPIYLHILSSHCRTIIGVILSFA